MARSLSDPRAFVLGDMDLVRPLGLAGVRCVALAPRGAAVTFSRFVDEAITWEEDHFPRRHQDLLDRLLQRASRQVARPVLFYEHDEHAWFVSRNRSRLSSAFRFVIAEESLFNDLVDKERFLQLAGRLELPVPPARVLSPATGSADAADDLRYPILVKPTERGETVWGAIDSGKAVRVDEPDDLRRLWDDLGRLARPVLAQQLVAGPESRIESYHVYIDSAGEIAGEFTGRKIRTVPSEYGYTTSLVITEAPDVAELGRHVARQIGLTGVAKVDFKRASDGRLWLLEVNPRFNLWHHAGALAGVNIPALVWADLTGRPRPRVRRPATAGVRWCTVKDVAAARRARVPVTRWLVWAAGCAARANLAPDDPVPILRRALFRLRHRGGAPDRAAKTEGLVA